LINVIMKDLSQWPEVYEAILRSSSVGRRRCWARIAQSAAAIGRFVDPKTGSGEPLADPAAHIDRFRR